MKSPEPKDAERRTANAAAIRAYLQREFPGQGLDEFTDPFRDGRGFRVRQKGMASTVASDEFLEDTNPAQVDGLLRTWDLAGLMRTAGRDMVVLVTHDGLRTEPARPR